MKNAADIGFSWHFVHTKKEDLWQLSSILAKTPTAELSLQRYNLLKIGKCQIEIYNEIMELNGISMKLRNNLDF